MNDAKMPAAEAGRQAFETIVLAFFGAPVVSAIDELPSNYGIDPRYTHMPFGETGNGHPVFAFAHHFQANDSGNPGYTGNGSRGDHMTIPVMVETGGVAAIDVDFHKGDIFVRRVTWPAAPPKAVEAATALLEAWYTR